MLLTAEAETASQEEPLLVVTEVDNITWTQIGLRWPGTRAASGEEGQRGQVVCLSLSV